MADATDQAPKDLIGFLDFYLVKKAPFQIPDAGKEIIVKFGPWAVVVLLVLTLPALLVLLGLGAAFTTFGGAAYATGFGLSTILLLVYLGLQVAALPGLFARKMMGWRLTFYARLVSFVSGLLAVPTFLIGGALIWGLIWLVVTLYVLFQVRALYKD
jgi:hypothetical protein